MGERAECVMLNKGQYLCGAVEALHDILQRMHDDQVKKARRSEDLSAGRTAGVWPKSFLRRAVVTSN
jgi:hypothetical protein